MNKEMLTLVRRTLCAALLVVAPLTAWAANDIDSLVNANGGPQITVVNDVALPWTLSGSEIVCGNRGKEKSASSLKLIFESTKQTRLDFGWWAYCYSSSYYHQVELYIDGQRKNYGSSFDLSYRRYYMEPGMHIIEFKDSIGSAYKDPRSTLRALSIREFDWIDVTLAQAGTLGYEVLYNIGDLSGVLDDVDQLRVHGPLNDADWQTIRQMHNLYCIDLTDAQISEVPNNAFSGLGYLQQALLPDGIVRIGDNAFSSNALQSITIPASVSSIGNLAFYNRSRLSNVSFAEGSQLKSIGTAAFSGCTALKEFIMPGTVTSLGNCAFYGCTAMEKIVFSDALTNIVPFTCYNCTSLHDVHLPSRVDGIRVYAFYKNSSLRHIDLPATVGSIEYYTFAECGLDSIVLPSGLRYLTEFAFPRCNNLTYAELPMYLNSGSYYYGYLNANGSNTSGQQSSTYGYRRIFSSCPNIRTVVCPSSTPPSVTEDLFESGPSKGNITLKVPKFSVVDYKLTNYWQPFNIVPGEDTGYMLLSGTLSLTNNRRPDTKNDIDIWNSGRLLVGGNATLPIGRLNIDYGGLLLSQCQNIVAESININYGVSANTWYFLTPSYDVSLDAVCVSGDALYVFRYYDGASRAANGKGNSWKDVTDGTLHAGQGYIFQASKAATLTLPATATGSSIPLFSHADISLPLQDYSSATDADKGWNYVGNPYCTYFDTYHMVFDAPITLRENNKWVAKRTIDDKVVLQPMQAFFVQKPDEQDALVFHKEGRQLTTETNHTANSRSTADDNRRLFNLLLSDDGSEDQTRVVLNEQASLGYELRCDAAKFMSDDDSPMLFTLDADGTPCSINERPVADGHIRLGYTAPQATTLTLSTTRADGEIWLHDHLTGQQVNLAQQSYSFSTEAIATPCTTRFTLITDSGITGIAEVVDSHIRKSQPVYDLQGRRLTNRQQRGIYVRDGKKVIVK